MTVTYSESTSVKAAHFLRGRGFMICDSCGRIRQSFHNIVGVVIGEAWIGTIDLPVDGKGPWKWNAYGRAYVPMIMEVAGAMATEINVEINVILTEEGPRNKCGSWLALWKSDLRQDKAYRRPPL